MLLKLAEIANKLDVLGLTKEADCVDSLIVKLSDDGRLGADECAPLTIQQYNAAIKIVDKIVMEGTDEGYLMSGDEFLRVLNSKLMGIRNSSGGFTILKPGDRCLYNLYNYYIKVYKWHKDGNVLNIE